MAAQNKVMQLWTTVITALLALCTALGLITTTAAQAAAQPEPTHEDAAHTADTTSPAMWTPELHLPLPRARSLPPTMKQRIGAEAHGKSPSCRHRQLDDSAESEPEAQIPAQAPALQRC
ncbi:DUF6344 domain-containing protein [Streptomyces sp. YIM S03343]